MSSSSGPSTEEQLSLPPWTSEAFKDRLARDGPDAAIPAFSWYDPIFLKKANSATGDCAEVASSFPPLREVLGLDFTGPATAAMKASQAALQAAASKGLSSSLSNGQEGENHSDTGEPAKKKNRGEKASHREPDNAAGDEDLRDDPETLAIFGCVGAPTPVEDLWYGPPMSAKVPPATDYERLLRPDA